MFGWREKVGILSLSSTCGMRAVTAEYDSV